MPLEGSGGTVTDEGNIATTTPSFADRAGYDYHLLEASPAIDAGVDPGTGGGMSLAPAIQYRHPAGSEPRVVVGDAIDVGAYEHGSAPVPGSDAGVPEPGTDASPERGADAGADGGTTRADDDGCGCRATTGRGALGSLALALLLLAAAGRGRRRVKTG